MKRREFIAGLGAVAWPLLVRAQPQAKPTIGLLSVAPGGLFGWLRSEAIEGIRRGLAEVLVQLTGYLRNPSLLMRARAQATVRAWKKRPELHAHSRFTIQDGCGLPVATGALS